MAEKKLGFKDFLTVDRAPGMDSIIKKQAKKRNTETSDVGENTISPTEETLNEILNPVQRRARSRLMKRLAPRIQMGARRAKMRTASTPKIKGRALKQARKVIFKKLSKGIDKTEMPFQRRQEIEKRLNTPMMKKKIATLALKLTPKVRRAEQERHQAPKDDDKK